jgi:hypothetical protein
MPEGVLTSEQKETGCKAQSCVLGEINEHVQRAVRKNKKNGERM